MKKSNIILLSVLLIILLAIVSLKIQFKAYLAKHDIERTELAFDFFNELEIEDGWKIELYEDSLTKISFYSDSIQSLVSLDQKKLILKASEIETKDKKIIELYTPKIGKVKISGNSVLHLHSNSTDTLYVNLNDRSNLILSPKKEDVIKQLSTIAYLDVILSNKSAINVYSRVNEMHGELNDSSHCYLSGEIELKNVLKSKEARINSR